MNHDRTANYHAVRSLVLVVLLILFVGWLVSPSYGPDSAGGRKALPASPQFSIDINAATRQELESLPSVGPSMAGAILASRQEAGPFASIQELDRVPGIGPATIELLASLVRVEARNAAPPLNAAVR